jgi:hypothetical protein
MNKIAIGLLTAGIVASSAFAGDDTVSKDYKAPAPVLPPCFADQELQIDGWGTITELASGNREGVTGLTREGGGGGLGVNYFFIRYLGIGADADLSNRYRGLWNTTAKVIVRVPFDFGGLCIAPYVYAGGGGAFADRAFDNSSGSGVGTYMVGGGLEYRITRNFGIFSEGRYTWPGDDKKGLQAAQGRFGFRVSF